MEVSGQLHAPAALHLR